MAKALPKPRESKITIPERCNPYARLVFAEMKRQCVTYDELEWRSGVLRCTTKAWRSDNAPGLASIEAALGALGWWFVPTPQEDRIPENIREKIRTVAEEWADFDEVLGRVLIGMCRPETLMPHRDDSAPIIVEGAFGEIPAKRTREKPTHPNQVSLFEVEGNLQ